MALRTRPLRAITRQICPLTPLRAPTYTAQSNIYPRIYGHPNLSPTEKNNVVKSVPFAPIRAPFCLPYPPCPTSYSLFRQAHPATFERDKPGGSGQPR